LARPNQIIVNYMRSLVLKTGCDPHPIQDLEEIYKIEESLIGAIVISTSVSSVVKQDYLEVLKEVLDKFPNKPVVLATLSSAESLEKVVSRSLLDWGVHRKLSDTDSSQSLSAKLHIQVISKKDLTDESTFDKALLQLRQLLASH
jgi:predicted RND superfamily exporter protein